MVVHSREKLFDLSKIENFEEMIRNYNIKTFAHLMHTIVSFLYPITCV